VPASNPAPAAVAPSPADYAAVVSAPDRSPEDRALDAGRHPSELLAFIGVRPGMKIAELAAGGGYSAELFARAVGPSGVVYGQNPKLILERYAEKPWSARLEKPIMKNVVRVDREFDDPLPPEAKNLDVVLMNLFYHDTVWMKVDRARMNQAIYQALKPGGVFVVIDHSAKAGTGLADVETLHRIEEPVLRAEIEKAGFKLVRESNVWRVPGDTRDWSTSPRVAGERRGTSDRFALVYARP
jgi:predicted methyltransferase